MYRSKGVRVVFVQGLAVAFGYAIAHSPVALVLLDLHLVLMPCMAVERAILADPFDVASFTNVISAGLLFLPIVREAVNFLLKRNAFLYFDGRAG